jgi:hypothetical protein
MHPCFPLPCRVPSGEGPLVHSLAEQVPTSSTHNIPGLEFLVFSAKGAGGGGGVGLNFAGVGRLCTSGIHSHKVASM